MASLDEQVKLRFLQWQDLYKEEKPFEIVTDAIQGSENRRTNLVFGTNGQQTVRDVRGRERSRFALDSHGFAYGFKPCPFDGYDDKQRIVEDYLPWAESVIQHEVGDSGCIFIFDWRVSGNLRTFLPGTIPTVASPVFTDIDSKLRRSDFTPQKVDLNELHQFLPVASTCHVGEFQIF